MLVVTMAVVPGTPILANAAPPEKSSTKVRHLVVFFQENVSFDHYFATYPVALNPKGEPAFHPLFNTPTVNGLSNALLTLNLNLNPANGAGATNPFRFDRSQAATQDMDHDLRRNRWLLTLGSWTLFPANTGTAGPPPNSPPPAVDTTGWATTTEIRLRPCGTMPSVMP